MSPFHAGGTLIATPGWPERSRSGEGQGNRDVRMDQGAACDRCHRVDGRHALSAAAVRLSLRRRNWIDAVRDVQSDGTAVAQGYHQPGDGGHLAGWTLPRLGRPLVRGGLGAWKD